MPEICKLSCVKHMFGEKSMDVKKEKEEAKIVFKSCQARFPVCVCMREREKICQKECVCRIKKMKYGKM